MNISQSDKLVTPAKTACVHCGLPLEDHAGSKCLFEPTEYKEGEVVTVNGEIITPDQLNNALKNWVSGGEE